MENRSKMNCKQRAAKPFTHTIACVMLGDEVTYDGLSGTRTQNLRLIRPLRLTGCAKSPKLCYSKSENMLSSSSHDAS